MVSVAAIPVELAVDSRREGRRFRKSSSDTRYGVTRRFVHSLTRASCAEELGGGLVSVAGRSQLTWDGT